MKGKGWLVAGLVFWIGALALLADGHPHLAGLSAIVSALLVLIQLGENR